MKYWKKEKINIGKIIKKNGLIIEEKVERFVIGKNGEKYSRGIVEYKRIEEKGKGFGKRKVGDKIIVVKEYIYEEILEDYGGKNKVKVKYMIGKNKVKGVIIRIVRRINNGYYDYWYKVKIENNKNIWRSYVEII